MDHYPRLDEKQKQELLRTLREEITKKPQSCRNGYWRASFPCDSYARRTPMSEQRLYVAEISVQGVVIVRNLDGDEVVRGELGWVWDSPIFLAFRSKLDLPAVSDIW